MEAGPLAYLEAMDIPVWVRKELADQSPELTPVGLKLGPGESEVLLVCSGIDEPAKRIATDIARCLSVEPVWAWPEAEGDAQDLNSLVAEQLFTSVIVFGNSLVAQLFNMQLPETIASARLLEAASLEQLESSPDARKLLWNLIKTNSLADYSRA
ncbi:MAG: hypothetical protein ACI9H8_000684 [Lysobacterales bacterium]|jgi:hypothetical protein